MTYRSILVGAALATAMLAIGCGDKGSTSSSSSSAAPAKSSAATPAKSVESAPPAKSAEPAPASDGITDADVDALLASKDRACACKDKACAEGEFKTYKGIVQKVGKGILTDTQTAKLKGSFKAAGECFVKKGIPADDVKHVAD
ncbi:MAG: hypothetical protein U0271_33365 [Polyangiaceae bacterium]